MLTSAAMADAVTSDSAVRAHDTLWRELGRVASSRLRVAVSIGLTVACGRIEEPRAGADSPPPTGPTPRTHSPERAPEIVSSRPAGARCIAPWPEAPPPVAHAAEQCPASPEPAPNLTRATVRFTEAPGQPTVNVELARTASERSRGLMYRTALAQDSGMLFSWSDEQQRSFWMHNTCLPLDMLFIAADETIVGILEQVPTLNDDARTVRCPAAHVLEVNAGWSRAHGVRPGQKIQLAR